MCSGTPLLLPTHATADLLQAHAMADLLQAHADLLLSMPRLAGSLRAREPTTRRMQLLLRYNCWRRPSLPLPGSSLSFPQLAKGKLLETV
jgi:hypothetical protein